MKKLWKIIYLGTLCQRASQIMNFLKIIYLGTPWRPEADFPSLRTCMNHGLGVPGSEISENQNWEGVENYCSKQMQNLPPPEP